MNVEVTPTQHTPERSTNNHRWFRWRLRRRQTQIVYMLAAVAIVLVLDLPLIYMAASSFKPSVEVYRVPPTFFPSKWVLDGYRELFDLTDMILAFRNSLIVATGASTLGVGLSVGFCYAITRFRMPGMRFFTALMLLVYILPGILLMIPMVKMWARLGLTGGLFPLAVTYVSFTLPFSIWMLRSHFAGIPVEL